MPTRRNAIAAASVLPFALVKASGAPKKPLRYLQIGVGHAHAGKISVYRESADWEVVGVVEEDPELLAKAKADPVYRDLKFMTLEEGLNTGNLQVVGVETAVRDLLRYARLAVESGFHVHLDKPAGSHLGEYREMMKAADGKSLVVQMGYMYRFNPAVQLLRRMHAAGWLGEVYETHAVMSKVMSRADRREVAEFPGGTMFELGCHIIDLTVQILGRPDRVVAYPRRVAVSEDDTLIDNMLAVFEYPKATATVRSSALEVDGFSRRQFTVCGTGGTFHIQPLDRPSVRLSLSQERSFGDGEHRYPKGTSEIPFEPPYVRYRGDAADLAAIVRGEKENRFPSAHDLDVQQAVLAASGMSEKE